MKRFTDYAALINTYLDQIIPAEDTQPEPIYRAMRYSLFAGGKRLRPILCIVAGESLGATPQTLLPVAAAVEMIHTYSLIHDDLPSMDNDDFRRGKPTSHRVFGEAVAILAGDALLTAAMETLAQAPYDAGIRCRLIGELTRAAGPRGMIGGQILDILSENATLDRVELEKIHGMKTAALIGYSATAPSVVLKSAPEVETAFRQYGEAIGLAFQIVDDILDVEGKSEILGKTAGKDREKRKATYPALLGLEESKALAADLVKTACQIIHVYDRDGALEALANHVLERKK
jgi:geranylgeranyl diphosphate synthase type II